MNNKEAIHKLEYMRNAYQKLIDEKVDEGRLVGPDITGTWKADTPLNDAYKEHIEALDLAITALEQQEPMKGKWIKHEHGYWSYVNEHGERDGWIPDYECSICGSRGWKNAEIGLMHFCPSCGAILEGIRK